MPDNTERRTPPVSGEPLPEDHPIRWSTGITYDNPPPVRPEHEDTVDRREQA